MSPWNNPGVTSGSWPSSISSRGPAVTLAANRNNVPRFSEGDAPLRVFTVVRDRRVHDFRHFREDVPALHGARQDQLQHRRQTQHLRAGDGRHWPAGADLLMFYSWVTISTELVTDYTLRLSAFLCQAHLRWVIADTLRAKGTICLARIWRTWECVTMSCKSPARSGTCVFIKRFHRRFETFDISPRAKIELNYLFEP